MPYRYILTKFTVKNIPLESVAETLEEYGRGRPKADAYLIDHQKIEINSVASLPSDLRKELERNFIVEGVFKTSFLK
jgi:hypothetical protein